MPTMPSVFRPKGQPSSSHARQLNEERRGTARQRGYTAKWDREAKAFKCSNPLCLGCLAVGRTAATAVVDHTIPHKGDHALFWDRALWQPCCKWHHDVVKKRLEQMYADGKIDVLQLRLDSTKAIELTLALDPK